MRKKFDSCFGCFLLNMEHLILESSYAKRLFKKRIGNANHLLITILVGLDAIEAGVITKTDKFKTSWNPKSKRQSAQRSSRFALNAALSWVIDNLDMYFILAHRTPTIIESEELFNNISGAGQSVSQKMDTYTLAILKTDDSYILKYASLVALGIQWRNNTTHYNAENKLEKRYRDTLCDKRNSKWYEDTFQGLSIIDSIKSFDKGLPPSFKEIAAIIRATHVYVDKLDHYLLSTVNVKRIAKETIQKHYSDRKKKKGHVLNYSEERKCSMAKMILLSYGFSETDEKYGNTVFELDSQVVDEYLHSAIKKR